MLDMPDLTYSKDHCWLMH